MAILDEEWDEGELRPVNVHSNGIPAATYAGPPPVGAPFDNLRALIQALTVDAESRKATEEALTSLVTRIDGIVARIEALLQIKTKGWKQ